MSTIAPDKSVLVTKHVYQDCYIDLNVEGTVLLQHLNEVSKSTGANAEDIDSNLYQTLTIRSH